MKRTIHETITITTRLCKIVRFFTFCRFQTETKLQETEFSNQWLQNFRIHKVNFFYQKSQNCPFELTFVDQMMPVR